MHTPVLSAAISSTPATFLPGQPWTDTTGDPIQAHGGGILAYDKVYYWYGENKSQGHNNRVGVSCYSSTDLVRWQSEGIVLPKSSFPAQFQDLGVCERPKVLYNAKTGKFVMWMHVDADGYRVSEAGIATADNPTGPFRWLSSLRPVESSTYRDMNLFHDDGGGAYALYAGEENQTMHVVRLNDEFTAPETNLVEGKNWARILVGLAREAPALFKHEGRYYIVSSACTGWTPNAADVAVADHILGPWKMLGNPCVGAGAGTTFDSQSTYILSVPGKPGAFIYMGDRWNEEDLANSRYMWLPMTVNGEKVEIHNLDHWDFTVFSSLMAGAR